MYRPRRVGRGTWPTLFLLCTSCSGIVEPGTQPPAPDHSQPGADARDEATLPPSEKVALRTALVPGAIAQPVRIVLDERRDTTGDNVAVVTHGLHLEIEAALTRTGQTPNGETQAKLTFEHLILRYGTLGQPEAMLSYDSAQDKAGNGNPLADVMEPFKDAEPELVIGPSGRLRRLAGLNERWGKTGMIIAPPALLVAQWLLRDDNMQELVAEALFPPMPASPVAFGDAWEVVMPANIPLVTRLNARIRSTLKTIDHKGDPQVTIEGTGTIEPAPPLLPGDSPAIQPVVKASTVKITQQVQPACQSLDQEVCRELEVLLTLTPPTGDERTQMTIRQTRTVASRRGE